MYLGWRGQGGAHVRPPDGPDTAGQASFPPVQPGLLCPDSGSPSSIFIAQVAQHDEPIRCVKYFEANGQGMLGASGRFLASSSNKSVMC